MVFNREEAAREKMRAGDIVHKLLTRCVNCGHGHTYSREGMNRFMRCTVCQKSYVACSKGDEPSSSTKRQRGSVEELVKNVSEVDGFGAAESERTKRDKRMKHKAEEDYTQLQKRMDELEKRTDEYTLKQHEGFMHADIKKTTHVVKPAESSDFMRVMADNKEFLSVLRNQTIRQSIEAARRQAAEIIAGSEKQKHLPHEFKTVQDALLRRLQNLETKETQRQQRRQELETMVLRIHEIQNLQTKIAKLHHQQRLKETLTIKLEEEESKQLPKTSSLLDLIGLTKQVEEQKIELESIKEQVASTNRKLDMQQERLNTVNNNVRWVEDRILDEEATQREVKETYDRRKLDLARIKAELDYEKRESAQLQRKISDDVIEIRQANKSIATTSSRF
ncbi:PREDICTED: polyamine-modulated factor 1-binding protein 1-like [Camelina sativa]|uniref:Polyamine-modulated factor 1-binding protein 1-like n=1 Tax=Camelina sativa TaxID=90675 RepID=A0ABM0XR66_CAMSA|nr:PREDICTED: polyamine-modulated factor 1-binding protein 1-like [Camelina sativa]